MNKDIYLALKQELELKQVELVAISKTKPVGAIQKMYDWGQRIFGENRARELQSKEEKLPKDIQWHMVGHLQRNKVKYIAPFVQLIHSVDGLKLLKEINKQAKKNDRVINYLLQVHIAEEENKHGFDVHEIETLLQGKEFSTFENINITGLMGMATFTDNQDQIQREFAQLKTIFEQLKNNFFTTKEDFNILSMGMSSDYQLAILEGANMVRIGSLIFGDRN